MTALEVLAVLLLVAVTFVVAWVRGYQQGLADGWGDALELGHGPGEVSQE